MTRRSRWALWCALGLATVGAGLALAFALLVPGNDEIAQRIAAGTEARIGVPVKIGSVRWQAFPPALVIEDAATQQPDPISFRRLVAQPNVSALLRRTLRFDHMLVEGGVMPQMALRGLHVVPAAINAEKTLPVAQLRFRNLTWITRHGKPLEFDGDIAFDPGWRPREAVIERPGVEPATRMAFTRMGEADRWQVATLLGGGTADGEVELQGAPGAWQLVGKLKPVGVEVDIAMAAFKRNSAVRGKANGDTVLTATGKTVGELARSLHTRTDFRIPGATLLHLDVDKAIRTLGQDRSGQTPLEMLAGRMDTQNTPEGIVVRYSGVQAQGQTFSASGGGTIAKRQVDGDIKVDVAGVAVPMRIDGPLAKPQVHFTPVGAAKAAIGGVGAAIGRLFGAGS